MKNAINILTYLMLIFSNKISSQINIGGTPYSWKNNIANQQKIPIIHFSELNSKYLGIEDKQDEQNGVPPRFGYKHQTDLSTANSGVWTELPNGDRLWQLEVSSPSALSINFLYNKFWLPEGGILYIYNKNKQSLIGGFTSANNKGNLEHIRGFGTGLVYGDDVILEYYEPHSVSQTAVIHISDVVHGYRYIQLPNTANKTDNFGDSKKDCEININCTEGSDWQNEKRGIALILVDGYRWCTGSLINNTSANGDLLFLTAHHCLTRQDIPYGGGIHPDKDALANSNADDWSFIWNYEAPNCANPVSEPSYQTTNGAIVVANNSVSDFALLRLSESPFALIPPYNAYFNGWDASGSSSQVSVAIHHPRGDIKKISTYNGTLGITNLYNGYQETSGSNFWKVNKWSSGIMEGGSSGAPLFNKQNYLIIGQHKGGNEDCNGTTSYDGRIAVSWNIDTTYQRQLKHWLDPDNTGSTSMTGGIWACLPVVNVSSPINTFADIQVSEHITANSTIASGANGI